MLLWTQNPNKTNCKEAKVGSGKFFGGRKKKFGLCFQGVCDVDWKFLDICIKHPASMSDYLAFSTSSLQSKLEKEGFLANGLALFGDSVYVNCDYMVTPYKGYSSGTEDDFYFYQSQLCINIECSLVLKQFCRSPTGILQLYLLIRPCCSLI